MVFGKAINRQKVVHKIRDIINRGKSNVRSQINITLTMNRNKRSISNTTIRTDALINVKGETNNEDLPVM